jgi:hypothetical protein
MEIDLFLGLYYFVTFLLHTLKVTTCSYYCIVTYANGQLHDYHRMLVSI